MLQEGEVIQGGHGGRGGLLRSLLSSAVPPSQCHRPFHGKLYNHLKDSPD